MQVVSSPDAVRIVRGRDAILALSRRLQEFSHRCGQPGAMDHLASLFDRPAFARKLPTLVLTLPAGGALSDEPTGAALVYEHRVLGLRCGVYSSDFHAGARTVIAPRPERPRVAFLAAAALLREGALLASVSYEGNDQPEHLVRFASPSQHWAARLRNMSGYLPIRASLDDTLAQFGKHTRRNLRYYRRLSEADFGATLIVSPHITQDEFFAFNTACLYAVPPATALTRYHALQQSRSGSFLLGLRSASGEWLSMVAGHSYGPCTVVEWQMNRAGLEHYSLCTAMRAHLLEHEVARGATRLYYLGGTMHTSRSAMMPEKIVDLIVSQPGVPGWIIKRIAKAEAADADYVGHIPAIARPTGLDEKRRPWPEEEAA